jgi:catechol 2,3-dioxygenase-like lactoylglutathione lyase family enzyme
MPPSHFVILYVDQPRASAAFYAGLLGAPVIEASDTFAMLPLREGVMLGLWSRHTVEPAAEAAGGGGELAFVLPGRDAVQARHDEWAGKGVRIAQAPRAMDFGYTFTGLDPDGHRLRVFCPEG